MRAMVLERPGAALAEVERTDPEAGPGEVLIAVRACGVCRTDLHLLDRELEAPRLPLILGHQAAGEVVGLGKGASRFATGERVGVPWLGWACGECGFCLEGRENLCPRAEFTGFHRDGGYAELTVADERFCLSLPVGYTDPEAAPLLCGGLIGFRALRMCGDAERVGLFGFGSAAHIVCQVAVAQGRRVFAFTRPGDEAAQDLARELGADWAGGAGEQPAELGAAIVFAPAGELVPEALRLLAPGGVVVCAGIQMTEIPAFAYELLWGERQVRSVANLTRDDGERFLTLAPQAGVRTRTTLYPLEGANDALADLRSGALTGSAVLDLQA